MQVTIEVTKEIPVMKLSVPQVGQRIKIVHGDDNGLGGQAITTLHTGHVSAVEKLLNGGFNIEIALDQHNFTDETDGDSLPKDRFPEAWGWSWFDEYEDCLLHPNGFIMPALMAFHYHCEYADNRYNEHNQQTDQYMMDLA